MLRTDVLETIEIMYFGQEEIMQMVPMGTAFLTYTVFIKVNIPFRKYFQSLLYQFACFLQVKSSYTSTSSPKVKSSSCIVNVSLFYFAFSSPAKKRLSLLSMCVFCFLIEFHVLEPEMHSRCGLSVSCLWSLYLRV